MLWTKAKYVSDSGSDAHETSQRLKTNKGGDSHSRPKFPKNLSNPPPGQVDRSAAVYYSHVQLSVSLLAVCTGRYSEAGGRPRHDTDIVRNVDPHSKLVPDEIS